MISKKGETFNDNFPTQDYTLVDGVLIVQLQKDPRAEYLVGMFNL